MALSSHNNEHTLIPVMARMIHSAVWNSKWFALKDGRPLHMVKLVGAVRNFRENIKHVQINVEDGTGSYLERFVLKDGQPLHMVKLVGAIRNFRENIKHIQINVEDGTGLVRVILWRKEKECTAQRQMIHECNSNCYIHVIGEVEDYYGVHEIIAFGVQPVSSGNKVTHHFLKVAYSFEKTLEYAEDEMLRAVPLK
jgi:hypothetical protein